MVQPKYNPEEALQRIKLMMSYDMGKTLNENKQIISEQSFGEIAAIAKELVDSLIGDVKTSDLSDVEETLKNKVFGKTMSDGKCLFSKVNEYFNTTEGNPWLKVHGDWGKHGNIKDKIRKSQERDEAEFEDVKQQLLKLIEDEENKFCKNPTPPKPVKPKPVQPINPGQSRYRNCDKEPRYTKGCRTRPEGPIGQVQACLGGLVQDGKFWDKTQAALEDAGYPNGFTIENIKTICGNQTKPEEVKPLPPDDEVSDVNNA
jgi:DNA-binding transcriptional MerR regulator